MRQLFINFSYFLQLLILHLITFLSYLIKKKKKKTGLGVLGFIVILILEQLLMPLFYLMYHP